MGTEIERTFLVLRDKLPAGATLGRTFVEQTYLSRDPWIRVRLSTQDVTQSALLTIKGPGTMIRPEFNYPIPIDEARDLWKLAKGGVVRKIRFRFGPWEIDQFLDELSGLWLAEIESHSAAVVMAVEKPDWLGAEVTDDIRYSNAYMAEHGLPRNA